MTENDESEDFERNSDWRTIVQDLKRPRFGKRSQKIKLTVEKVQPVYVFN